MKLIYETPTYYEIYLRNDHNNKRFISRYFANYDWLWFDLEKHYRIYKPLVKADREKLRQIIQLVQRIINKGN